MTDWNIVEDLRLVRERRPLVHQITNYVVMNETANMTLALGALPVMAHAHEELDEMVAMASSLALNIGTLDRYWVESMLIAGKHANRLHVPIVLDPVGAGATSFRTDSARLLMDSIDIAVIRGNAGEIGVLAGSGGEVRGVESISDGASAADAARTLAKADSSTIAVSGPVDIVTDGHRTARILNGHPLMGCVTGTGCMSTAIIAAFCAVQPDAFKAAVGAMTVFGIAGELAAEKSAGPGSFHTALYDAVAAVDEPAIKRLMKVES